MNPSSTHAGEPEYSVEPWNRGEDTPSWKHGETHDSAWLLEDLEEPEPWALASFEDLLPHELA